MKPLDALPTWLFQTILCSPAFLHVHEGTGKLNDFALASRLSYFFWSSTPDQTLIQLAAAGNVREPATPRRTGGSHARLIQNRSASCRTSSASG